MPLLIQLASLTPDVQGRNETKQTYPNWMYLDGRVVVSPIPLPWLSTRNMPVCQTW